MVRELGHLALQRQQVCLVTHQLVHSRIPVRVHPIVVWLHQVALDVVERLELNSGLRRARPRPHGWVLSAVDELANSEDCHHTEVLREHQGCKGDGESSRGSPLN